MITTLASLYQFSSNATRDGRQIPLFFLLCYGKSHLVDLQRASKADYDSPHDRAKFRSALHRDNKVLYDESNVLCYHHVDPGGDSNVLYCSH